MIRGLSLYDDEIMKLELGAQVSSEYDISTDLNNQQDILKPFFHQLQQSARSHLKSVIERLLEEKSVALKIQEGILQSTIEKHEEEREQMEIEMNKKLELHTNEYRRIHSLLDKCAAGFNAKKIQKDNYRIKVKYFKYWADKVSSNKTFDKLEVVTGSLLDRTNKIKAFTTLRIRRIASKCEKDKEAYLGSLGYATNKVCNVFF
jgi:hypothetical protein